MPWIGTGSPMLLRPASGASSYYGTNRSSDGQPARHHSPKMKLKYMKSIFPKAEETLILDVLANKDNNVQKASEELQSMGFSKKETVVEKPPRKTETPQPVKKLVTIMKTMEEKNELKNKLQKKYSSVAERVVTLALESVGYNEERAEQMLAAVLHDDPPKVSKLEVEETRRSSMTEVKKGPILKSGVSAGDARYKSTMAGGASGPNFALRQGPKDSLLLEEYITWNGPNPDLRTGQVVSPSGPESRDKHIITHARGPQALAKGPSGLAKGSMFQKLNKKSAKIVV
ncbi:hypothetical protein O0L34_g2312 [Tuta absoluta]|nr:hypothetical protein O0L34_g2312 [Tuta absoluta]